MQIYLHGHTQTEKWVHKQSHRNACHSIGPFPPFRSQNEGHPHGKCGWYFNCYWMFPFIVLDALIFHNMSSSRKFSWPLINSSILKFLKFHYFFTLPCFGSLSFYFCLSKFIFKHSIHVHLYGAFYNAFRFKAALQKKICFKYYKQEACGDCVLLLEKNLERLLTEYTVKMTVIFLLLSI